MSTAELAPSATALRRPRQTRRLEQPYPLFGFRFQVYRLALLHRHAEIHEWLLRQDQQQPEEEWQARWQRCQRQRPAFFKEIWVVHLPRPSRSLNRGNYVFDPLTDFLHIPGSPPAVVQDCYREAFAELPRHQFAYLDLLWDSTAAGMQWLSVEQLRANLCELEHTFRRRLRHDRLLIDAARARQREMLAKLQATHVLMRELRLPATPTEARKLLGLSDETLRRSLREQMELIAFIKFDPAIVFEEPALLKRAGGYMPLGLVAHWD